MQSYKKVFLPQNTLSLILTGLASGVLNGLIGAGGGIFIVFGLSALIADKRDLFANALAVMLPSSIVSVVIYMVSGHLDFSGMGRIVIPAAIGGVIGAFLLDRIDPTVLKRLFAIVVIWSGLYMVYKGLTA